MRFMIFTLTSAVAVGALIPEPATAQTTTTTQCMNLTYSISCTSQSRPSAQTSRAQSAAAGAAAGYLLGDAIQRAIEDSKREKQEKHQREAEQVTRLIRASLEELAVGEVMTWEEANRVWSGFFDAYTIPGMKLVIREVVGADRNEWVTYHWQQSLRARLAGVDFDTDAVRDFAIRLIS